MALINTVMLHIVLLAISSIIHHVSIARGEYSMHFVSVIFSVRNFIVFLVILNLIYPLGYSWIASWDLIGTTS